MLWNMLFGLCILGVVKFGDYITDECPQGGYSCPITCDVDHKHYPREECNGRKKNEKKKEFREEENQEFKEIELASEKLQVLTRDLNNGKTKQESKPDSTIIQSVE